MGLKQMLTNGDSTLSTTDFNTVDYSSNLSNSNAAVINSLNDLSLGGNTPAVNPLSTNQSILHATPTGLPGHSLDAPFSSVPGFADYNDGVNNTLPFPSSLDRTNFIGVGVGNSLIMQSKLHATPAGNPGYSLDGSFINEAQSNANLTYDDGVPNTVPLPSQIDLNGVIPATSNHNNPVPGASTQALPYINNLPI